MVDRNVQRKIRFVFRIPYFRSTAHAITHHLDLIYGCILKTFKPQCFEIPIVKVSDGLSKADVEIAVLQSGEPGNTVGRECFGMVEACLLSIFTSSYEIHFALCYLQRLDFAKLVHAVTKRGRGLGGEAAATFSQNADHDEQQSDECPEPFAASSGQQVC